MIPMVDDRAALESSFPAKAKFVISYAKLISEIKLRGRLRWYCLMLAHNYIVASAISQCV